MKLVRLLTIFAAVAMLAAPALADWNEGDGHKMHYPQLPDPNGWDVDVTTDTVYDDWKCSASGPVSDIHFWVSWKGDILSDILWIDVSIHGDVPADQGGEFSHPDSVMYGDPLWFRSLNPGDWVYRPYGQGDQGWFSPEEPSWNRPDHVNFDQINITGIVDPFVQEEGTIYWLGIHIGVADTNTSIGWKTTLDHWNDDAAYYYGGQWNELVNPIEPFESLDMAFVITPEPSTFVLLGLCAIGGLAFLRRRS